MGLIRLRDGLALEAAAVVAAILPALVILPGLYPPRVTLGDLRGLVLPCEVMVTKTGGRKWAGRGHKGLRLRRAAGRADRGVCGHG